MTTKLGLLCDRVIEMGWLSAAVTVPLYFNIYSSRVFEPDKLIALRCIVLLMVLAFFVRFFEQGSFARMWGEGAGGFRGVWRSLRSDNPLTIPTLLFSASLVVSTLASLSPDVSIWGSYQRLQGTYTALNYIVLFFLVAQGMRSKAQLNRLITVVILTSLPISLYGMAQHQKLDPLPWGGDVQSRVASTMGNAIFLAAHLIMVVPLTIARLNDAISRLRGDNLLSVPTSLHWVGRFFALAVLQQIILILYVANAIGGVNLWWGAFGAVAISLNLSLLFYLRTPTRQTVMAEAVGYAALLLIQLTAIFLTQSRGPWLGLAAGLFFFELLLAIRSRSSTLLTITAARYGLLIAFLILFNAPNTPLAPFRSVPYVGRLGALLETEGGTGKVRLLIWQGAWELFTRHPSVGPNPDNLNFLRPVIGYGPEAMYVAFNKVYPPELAHLEARNASPDRAHQATLDLLVMTGTLGLAAFSSVVLAALLAALAVIWRTTHPYYHLILAGLVSAIASFLVETQFGIPIASTLTYSWLFFGVIVACVVMQRNEAVVAPRGGHSMIAESRLTGFLWLLFGVFVHGFVSRPNVAVVVQGDGGSATAEPKVIPLKIAPSGKPESPPRQKRKKARNGATRPMPMMRHQTWAGDSSRWLTVGAFVLLSSATMFALLRMAPIENMQHAYIGGFAWLVAGIIVPSVAFGEHGRAQSWITGRWWMYLPASALVALLMGLNLNLVVADEYYKRGFAFEGQRQWEASVHAYQEALKFAPNQDFYYLFLGRVFLELGKGNNQPKATPAPVIGPEFIKTAQPRDIQRLGKEDLLEASRAALEEARRVAPLNTDHTANLGRLYRFWGTADRSKLDLSMKYYEEAVGLSPQAAHLWDERAEVYMSIGQFDRAIEYLQVARDLDGEFPLTFLYLGDTYIAIKKPAEALDAHSKVLKLDPQSLSDQKLESRISFYLESKLADQLVPPYAAAAEKNPDNAAIRSAFGYLLSRLGRIPEASKEFEAWVRIAPKEFFARRNLALSYEALGRKEAAVREAEEAQNLAPPDQKEALSRWITAMKQSK